MKINLKQWAGYNRIDVRKIVAWLNGTFGKSEQRSDGLFADTWRMYSTEHSVEGYFETGYWLEFDNEIDATAFLLKWTE